MARVLTVLAFAAAVGGLGGAAQAAVMTFDELDGENGDSLPYVEDGITAVGQLGEIATYGYEAAHLDDSGTGFAYSVSFTTGGLFDAKSFDLISADSAYDICNVEENVCQTLPFANVMVQGFLDGVRVAVDTFDMFKVSRYFFDSSFAGLDELVIGFAPRPFEGWLSDGSYVGCTDAPCTHFNIDNVTLAPVPLPAGLGLLASALGALGLAAGRRKRAG